MKIFACVIIGIVLALALYFRDSNSVPRNLDTPSRQSGDGKILPAGRRVNGELTPYTDSEVRQMQGQVRRQYPNLPMNPRTGFPCTLADENGRGRKECK